MKNQYNLPDMVRVCEDKDKEIRELKAENARFRKALEEIARVRRGLEMTDTDEYRADYFFRQADNYSDLARKALRGPSPA